MSYNSVKRRLGETHRIATPVVRGTLTSTVGENTLPESICWVVGGKAPTQKGDNPFPW